MRLSVPAMILRRLYVKRSLKNIDNGFEFTLKNILADASIVKPLEISVNDNPVPVDKITLISDSKTISNKDISESNPLEFSLNTTVTVRIEGVKLEQGEHKILITGVTKEYGKIKFDIKDKIE